MSLEEDDEKLEILNNHRKQIEKDGYKKYVVAIKKEYVHLVDSMSIDERNEIINEIISFHNDSVNQKQQIKQITKGIIIAVISIVVLIFFIPTVLWLINKSFSLTESNYSEMQNNFEVLYDKGN